MGELISLTQAKRLASRGTIDDAIRAGRIPVYTSGLDRRKLLVRAEDVRQLSEVRQIDRQAIQEVETATPRTAA